MSEHTPPPGDAIQPAGAEIAEVRHGMWGSGTGDTSGFGGLVREVAIWPATAPPYGGWFDGAILVLGDALRGMGVDADEAIERVVVDRGELTVFVRREHIVDVCRALRDDPDLRFELSLGVNGVHYPEDAGRELHAVYHLLSITNGSRWLRLEVAAPDADPHIPSTTSIYPANDWHERETYDLFGIIFDGHSSLARIAMPDDWVGHPQRKDYPLGGIDVEYLGASVPPPDERRSYR